MLLKENRTTLSYISSFFVNLAIALLIGSVFLILQGNNPLVIFYDLFIDPFTKQTGLIKVLGESSPYIFTGLASAIAFRCGIFNIGVEGQLYIGGLAATLIGCYVHGLPTFALILLAIVAAMVAGGLWAFLAGWLKVKLKVHEVISTIMLNYVATNLVSYVIVNFARQPGPSAQTPNVADSARLSQLFPPEHLNTGLFIGIAVVAIMFILFKYLPLGWKIDSSGLNMQATKYSGIDSKKVILLTMFLSGAIAALCGVERTLGAYGYMQVGFSPGYGFDGITVAIIAYNNPIAVLFISILFGLFNTGGVNLNMLTNVPVQWVSMLTAIMLVLVAAQSGIFTKIIELLRKPMKRRANQ
jgi:ABC-type uncharacterized transport system, permease component